MIVAKWFPIVDSGEDLESVHEAMVDLAGSTATKRNRAKQISKTPEKIISLSCSYLDIEFSMTHVDAVWVNLECNVV